MASASTLLLEAVQLLVEDVSYIGQIVAYIVQSTFKAFTSLAVFINQVWFFLLSFFDTFTFSLDSVFKFFCYIFLDVPVLVSDFVIEFVPNNHLFRFLSFLICASKWLLSPVADLLCVLNNFAILVIDQFINLYLSMLNIYKSGNFGLSLCLLIIGVIFGGTIIEMAVIFGKRFTSKITLRNRLNQPRNDNHYSAHEPGLFSQEEQQKTCCVCLTEERSIVLLPCTHFCLCSQCSVALSAQTQNYGTSTPLCPVCRAQIREFMPIISS